MKNENVIVGRNAVLETLNSDRNVESILIASDRNYKSMSKIIFAAKEKKIPIKRCASKKLDDLSLGTAHQGIAAIVSAYSYSSVEDILKKANDRDESPFIIVADGVEDPHNLGAIIRTVECVGAHGVIIPSRRAAGLTPIVGKTSAGAIEYVDVARVTNISKTLDDLKKNGLWIFGAEADGNSWCESNLSGPIALVIGSEGKGLSRLVKEKCDSIISLPMNGEINSLNASVAAGILMYEVLRQRNL